MHYLIIAASILAQAQAQTRSAQNYLTVGEVLDRWEAGADLIESYDLSLKFTGKILVDKEKGIERLLAEKNVSPSPPTYSRIYRKAGKRRGEFARDEHGHYPPPIIWDGKTAYNFQPDLSVVIAHYILAFGGEESEDYEAGYRMVMGTIDRIALSKARKSRLLPREGNLYVVDVPASPLGDFNNVRWRVWLDPDRNFLPVRLTQWIVKNRREMLSAGVENELSEVAPGVWAPVRSTRRLFHKDEKSKIFGKCGYVCELKVIENQSKFNGDVPDALFEPKIPNGMTVIDRNRNAVYTYGSSDPGKYLAQLAR